MSRKPISCTWPPKCLHVRPCANSCSVVTVRIAIHARKRFWKLQRRDRSPAISFRWTRTVTSAQRMSESAPTTNAGVKKNPRRAARRSSRRSGSKALKRTQSRSPWKSGWRGRSGGAPGPSSRPPRRSCSTNGTSVAAETSVSSSAATVAATAASDVWPSRRRAIEYSASSSRKKRRVRGSLSTKQGPAGVSCRLTTRSARSRGGEEISVAMGEVWRREATDGAGGLPDDALLVAVRVPRVAPRLGLAAVGNLVSRVAVALTRDTVDAVRGDALLQLLDGRLEGLHGALRWRE